ncbi:MAG: CooT family nickel-binding protein [Chloroflexi bacterium]|nr:CooT family nickel-binding protein [Chloroflexota bacterium]
MCLAKAYLSKGEETEFILEDVVRLIIEGNNLNLRTLFGEQKEINGFVKEVDFQNSRILIEQIG